MSKKKIASTIYTKEVVDNSDIRYPHLEAKQYYPIVIETVSGKRLFGFLTANDIKVALRRANNNPEDMDKIEPMGVFKKLLEDIL